MLLKKGIVFPAETNLESYSTAISCALKSQLGTTHQAVKTVMKWTGAGERTVKNWFAGVSGPSGTHLVRLIQNSDETLAAILILAGRKELLAATRIVDIRNRLAETVLEVDQLLQDARQN
jgi:predicted ATP-grasp superfamily ATP-dependent carboligase